MVHLTAFTACITLSHWKIFQMNVLLNPTLAMIIVDHDRGPKGLPSGISENSTPPDGYRFFESRVYKGVRYIRQVATHLDDDLRLDATIH